MKMKFEWEIIFNNLDKTEEFFEEITYRAKIIGGWLIRNECASDYGHENNNEDYREEYKNRNNSMVFIPDPNHEWEIEE